MLRPCIIGSLTDLGIASGGPKISSRSKSTKNMHDARHLLSLCVTLHTKSVNCSAFLMGTQAKTLIRGSLFVLGPKICPEAKNGSLTKSS